MLALVFVSLLSPVLNLVWLLAFLTGLSVLALWKQPRIVLAILVALLAGAVMSAADTDLVFIQCGSWWRCWI